MVIGSHIRYRCVHCAKEEEMHIYIKHTDLYAYTVYYSGNYFDHLSKIHFTIEGS